MLNQNSRIRRLPGPPKLTLMNAMIASNRLFLQSMLLCLISVLASNCWAQTPQPFYAGQHIQWQPIQQADSLQGTPVHAPTVQASYVAGLDSKSIANSILDAASNFDAKLIPDDMASKRQFVQRASELTEFLQRATSASNQKRWLDYLDMEPLIELIESDGSASKMGREAIALQQRLVGTAPGLELSKVRALRVAVNQLIPAIRFRDKDRTTKAFEKQFKSVAEKLEEMESIPSVDDTATASLVLDLLSETNQKVYARDHIRGSFSHPNISLWISEGVVQTALTRPVNETTPVRDCILGTTINGTATTNGVVTANLIPIHGAIGVNVALSGSICSQNRGYRKPVTLQTTGYGNVFASRNIYASEAGIWMDPTYVDASLRTQINSIQHRLRIVRRIAKKKAAQQKPKADAIGLQKLRRKLNDQFTQQTNAASNVVIPDFMAKVRPMLLRLDLPEPTRAIGSTSQAIYLQSTIQRSDQLAAPIPAPPIVSGYDAAIQVHESAINNSIGYLLAGRTIKQTQIDSLMAQAGANENAATGSSVLVQDSDPNEDDKKEAKSEEPFEIDFATSRPIIFEARDGKVRIGVRGTRFAQGKRALKRSLEITASYSPARTADGAVMLVRDGDVDIDFPGKRKLSIAQAGMKAPIKKNFANVFPETLMHQPITVPMTVKSDAFRGRVYRPRNVTAENGWFTVVLQ